MTLYTICLLKYLNEISIKKISNLLLVLCIKSQVFLAQAVIFFTNICCVSDIMNLTCWVTLFMNIIFNRFKKFRIKFSQSGMLIRVINFGTGLGKGWVLEVLLTQSSKHMLLNFVTGLMAKNIYVFCCWFWCIYLLCVVLFSTATVGLFWCYWWRETMICMYV